MKTFTRLTPRDLAELHRIIKCRIKVKTAKGKHEYTGIYRSTVDAALDAIEFFGVESRISVRPM
jgi:hypothetical protein